jgi:hypothetical protein
VARVKERIAWYEKVLYDDLTGLKQDQARTLRNPNLSLANEKLTLAIRLCNGALSEVQNLRDRVPREVLCSGKHHEIRRQIDSEVMALNDVEGKLSNLNMITSQYRSLRLEAATLIQDAERRR